MADGAIESHRHGAVVTYDVSGDIDMMMRDRADAMLEPVRPNDDVQVNMGAVTFMDSTGLIFLLSLRNKARSVRLVDVPRMVMRVLTLTGSQDLFSYGTTAT
ncbi:STAS domain-containing protein [uncultured Jatrophihabitans sp.]|uniref:STAS domain-containing protein n=1 Tax=uncultured Jatrophihabitans sp. TaxID=1610747 RepID=UPI0035CB4F6C